MSEFLSMGGYAFYVWGSYAATFALLALESYEVVKRFRKARRHP